MIWLEETQRIKNTTPVMLCPFLLATDFYIPKRRKGGAQLWALVSALEPQDWMRHALCDW